MADGVGDERGERGLADAKRALDVTHHDAFIERDRQEATERTCGCEQQFRARNLGHLAQHVCGLDALERPIQHPRRQARDQEAGDDTNRGLEPVRARIRHAQFLQAGGAK